MDNRLEAMEERMKRTEDGLNEVIRMMRDDRANENHRTRRGRSRRHRTVSEESDDENRGEWPGFSERKKKLDLPTFNGEDVYGWLNKVERYFQVNGLTTREKVLAVMLVMEGPALNWYQWWEKNATNINWTDFREEVQERFRLELSGSPYQELLKLKQEGSVAEFRAEFERVISTIDYADDNMLREI